MNQPTPIETIKIALAALPGVSWNDRITLINAVAAVEAELAKGREAIKTLEAQKPSESA